MTIILFSILIFLSLVQWMILIDVILSWLSLIGVYFRPKFIQAITTPLYETVRRYIPSSFSGIDFAPIIVFIAIEFMAKLIITIDPGILSLLPK